jgi:hypothetical protein
MRDITRNRISLLCVLGVLLVCSLLAFGFAPSARADGITTYTYTGQPFTNFFGVDSCTNGVGQCSLSGSVTLASALQPNSFFFTGAPLSFSFTDGVSTINNNTISEDNPTFIYIQLVTEADDQIVGWLLQVGTDHVGYSSVGPDDPHQTNPLADITDTPFGGASNLGTPGTWTSSPEPSSLILFGTGFLGMTGAWRWKKLRQARPSFISKLVL